MIEQYIKSIKEQLPPDVTLIAVSKTHTPEVILDAYKFGIRDFAENKVQEMMSKYQILPKDIQWHMIGHLQRNKVKYIVPFVHLIQSVDSVRLLAEIQKEAAKVNRIVPVLLQVHIAQEEQKFGFTPMEVLLFIDKLSKTDYPNIAIKGLMGMGTFTDNQEQLSYEFNLLSTLFKSIKTAYSSSLPDFSQLSMGMSSDYLLAIKHGSTMVRIGSLLFGERYYNNY